MRRFVMAALLVLITGVAWASPTCWDCVDRLCEHKIAYPFLSCWSGPGYCTAGGGECSPLASEQDQQWLIADWELADIEITVEVVENGATTENIEEAGIASDSVHVTQSEAPLEVDGGR